VSVLVVAEHDRGELADATLEAMAAARAMATALGTPLEALCIGAQADGLRGTLAAHGAARVHQARHEILSDYGPEAWGEVLAQAVRTLAPGVVVACGTPRGNEVLAQAAARLDLPMVANCVSVDASRNGTTSVTVTRTRWGGSLLEDATAAAPTMLLSVAHHAFEAAAPAAPAAGEPAELAVALDASLARSVVRGRTERAAGVTLSTAPVVVGGGRGVGSADGFAPLQELASLLGGVVGCSRAVTNNGWRNHADQVGQTGTRIAPDVYFACGISGAIQHWVGAMASKHIIAINTDPQANMVLKAGYAVIGDLHKVVPAISAEIRRRRGG
jgi:electron transfer flavoprotein alpha subunit